MIYDDLLPLIERCGVHEVLGSPGRGYGIEQNAHELATFLSSIDTPRTVLEIGTGYRAGLARFLSEFLLAQVTTVDNKDYGHKVPGIEFIVSDERVKFDHAFDLVMIDADHTYDNLAADYVWYNEYASQVISIHDIAGLRACEGVARFWHELAYTKAGKLRKNFHEAIADGEMKAGIGWITK